MSPIAGGIVHGFSSQVGRFHQITRTKLPAENSTLVDTYFQSLATEFSRQRLCFSDGLGRGTRLAQLLGLDRLCWRAFISRMLITRPSRLWFAGSRLEKTTLFVFHVQDV